MTDAQRNLVRSLVAERELPAGARTDYVIRYVAGNAPEPNWEQTRSMIDWLIALPAKAGSAARASFPELPEGRYAVEPGDKLRFFKIDRPSDGKWKGYQFLNEIIGGETSDGRSIPIRDRNAKAEILGLIAEDHEAAAARYGREVKRCGYCHILLTDDLSRAVGIGPDCAEHRGIDRKALLARMPAAPVGPDDCDRCGKGGRELYHDDDHGAICDDCCVQLIEEGAEQADDDRLELSWSGDDEHYGLATEADAHAEWHLNAGVPIGTPGCPQDACHADEEYELGTVDGDAAEMARLEELGF